jgi:hypothetical protein
MITLKLDSVQELFYSVKEKRRTHAIPNKM